LGIIISLPEKWEEFHCCYVILSVIMRL